jgi:hypothetical protein
VISVDIVLALPLSEKILHPRDLFFYSYSILPGDIDDIFFLFHVSKYMRKEKTGKRKISTKKSPPK